METTQIQCPHCNVNIEILEDAGSVSCPQCGRILLIEHVAVPLQPQQQPAVKPKPQPEAPLTRDDKIAGMGLLILLVAVVAVFFGLNLKIFILWLSGGCLTVVGIVVSVLGLKSDRKERFAASMLVGFIALFFILMGLFYWL